MLFIKYLWPDGVICSFPTLIQVICIGSHVKCSSDGGLSVAIQRRVETPAVWGPGSGGLENTDCFSAA